VLNGDTYTCFTPDDCEVALEGYTKISLPWHTTKGYGKRIDLSCDDCYDTYITSSSDCGCADCADC
jgi:hypothetical protein